MKKLLSVILIFLIAAVTSSVVACNNTEPADGVASFESTIESSGVNTDQSAIQSNDEDGEYTIEFFVQDESYNTVKYNSTDRSFVLTPCNKTGYVFNGWFDEDGNEVFEIDPSLKKDYRLYASVSPIEYNVTFDANGGSGNMSGMVLVYDLSATLIPNEFTNGDRPFKGWALTVDGDVKYNDRGSIINACDIRDGTVVLYAVWGKAGEIELPEIII